MSLYIGEILEGEVIDFTHEGNGVIKVDNFTLFVNGGVIGDRVKVKVNELKKSYGIGKVLEIIEPSKDRIKLDFPLEESKGAIPLVEYSYEKQLVWKKEKVFKDLEKIAGLTNLKVNSTIGMNNPYRYRNHVQIPIGERNGRIVMGFYEASSNSIVDMNGSILQPEIGDKILNTLREWMEKYNIPVYDRRSKKGVMRHLGIRINKDNQAMVILVTGSDNLPKAKELIDMLKKDNVISIYQNINKLNSSLTYGNRYKKLYGEDYLVDYIKDFKFNISPNSFFQVNRIQTEVLYDKVVEFLDLNKEDIVYDLYSGIGTISMFIAGKVKKVYGIELVKEAIADANKNAKLNGVQNAEFIVGKTEEVFPEMIIEGNIANKVVLDPPRKGCEKETLEAIINLSPEKIVYVSCNSATMARDVKYLVDSGYEVVEVQPVDMFPHTAHIECVIGMQRKDT